MNKLEQAQILIKEHLEERAIEIAPKKVISQTPRNFRGGIWDITRENGKVLFGCGAVKVNQKDLVIVAEYLKYEKLKTKALERLVKGYVKGRPIVFSDAENIILGTSPVLLRKIAGI